MVPFIDDLPMRSEGIFPGWASPAGSLGSQASAGPGTKAASRQPAARSLGGIEWAPWRHRFGESEFLTPPGKFSHFEWVNQCKSRIPVGAIFKFAKC